MTGWAFSADRGMVPQYGTWDLGAGGLGRRASCLAASLGGALGQFHPEMVIMEAPLPPQARAKISQEKTTRLLLGLAAVVDLVCYEHTIDCEEAGTLEARRAVLGKRGDKLDVMAWCRIMGWVPPTHDAADALLLLEYRHGSEHARKIAAA